MDLIETDIRNLLDAAPDATVVVNEVGQIVFANKQVAEVFGYHPAELLGQLVEVLLPERFQAKHSGHRAAFLDAPKVRPIGSDIGLWGRRKDGSEFTIEVSLSPLQTANGTLVSSAIRDSTQRKALEAALIEARDIAERATASKSRFLAAASHDLRQPLQSIALYLDVLDKVVRDKPDTALEVSAKIDKSLTVMGELLDALLDISVLDSGLIKHHKRDFSLQTLFSTLAADNDPPAKEQGLRLTIEPCDATVHSDPALLQRILENFVTNAIRYTERGEVTVTCRPEGDQLKIEVRDTGIGIPQASIDAVFEEYFQLENPVRDRRKGLGLGLSIVRHIGDLLQTPLGVVSELGRGSVFSVIVPVGSALEERNEPAKLIQPKRQRDGKPTILFVEDDPAIVDATCMMLEIVGVDVKTALDGSAAIAMLEAGLCPDMLISDFRLPGANGVEVVRCARALWGDDLEVMLMTGDTSGHAIENEKFVNCTILHKPVDGGELIALIEKSLGQEQTLM